MATATPPPPTNILEVQDQDVQPQPQSKMARRPPHRNSRSKRTSKAGSGSGKGSKVSKGADLKDPELYEALMKQCVLEESLMAAEATSSKAVYKAPGFVTQYLARNDVRPLKKVSL